MNAKEKNLPVFFEDGVYDDFNAPDETEYSGELDVGPVRLRSKSKGSDNTGLFIGGVLAGGAVAIGAVVATISLLGVGKNS